MAKRIISKKTIDRKEKARKLRALLDEKSLDAFLKDPKKFLKKENIGLTKNEMDKLITGIQDLEKLFTQCMRRFMLKSINCWPPIQ
jgi:cytochrome c2